jgi:hypothetical protein
MERYVLTKSAHNEGKLIGNAMGAVFAQTILPPLWASISNRSPVKYCGVITITSETWPPTSPFEKDTVEHLLDSLESNPA